MDFSVKRLWIYFLILYIRLKEWVKKNGMSGMRHNEAQSMMDFHWEGFIK